MRDAGDDFTEQALRDLENRLTMEYTKAEEEVRRKAMEFFEQYEKDYRAWQAAVDRGEKTERQFRNWQQREMAQGERWNALKEQLSQDLYHTDQIARSITDGYMPEVYAINHNYGIYEIEVGNNVKTSLTLYNREAVERLMRDDPELLPPPGKAVSKKIAQGKAERWTRQKLQSIMTQGILQGESISRIATRLAKETGESNRKAAIRNARTMATNAENAGRYDAYRRADEMGIPLTIEWMATLDQRTRHDHRLLHGQRRNIDEPFEVSGVKILYPAQLRGEASDIPQHEIWNCRCTLLAWVKGFEGETLKRSRRMKGMSFEEWQQAKPVSQDILHTDRYTRDVPTQTKAATQRSETKQVEIPAEKKDQRPAEITIASDPQRELRDSLRKAYEDHRKQNNLGLIAGSELDDSVFVVDVGTDQKIQEALASRFRSLAERWDTTASGIRQMSSVEVAAQENAMAITKPNVNAGSSEIAFNPRVLRSHQDMVDTITRSVKSGFLTSVPDSEYDQYIMTHEFAHTLLDFQSKIGKGQNAIGVDFDRIRAARKEITAIRTEHLQEIARAQEKADELAAKVGDFEHLEFLQDSIDAHKRLQALTPSEYAMSNADEYMAESFVAVELGKTQNPYAIRVVDVLRKYFGR